MTAPDASAAEPTRGALRARFEVSALADLSLARLRLVTAAVAFMASLAVLLSRVPVTIFLVALLGALISLAWARQALALRRRAAQPSSYFLEVYDHGLLLAEGPSVVWLPWGEVCDIDVDEERLDIVVIRRGVAPLRLEARYPGIAIHDLMRTLRNAWRDASDS